MQWNLNSYRFLLVPGMVLASGLAWAFFADPAITYLAGHLHPERQDQLRRINDVVAICIVSVVMALRIRKQQYALIRSEEEYRRLFEANPNPMWIYDRQTLRFLRVNSAAVDKYGYGRERFLKMTIYDIRPKEAHPSLDALVSKNTKNCSRPEYGSIRAGAASYLMYRSLRTPFNGRIGLVSW